MSDHIQISVDCNKINFISIGTPIAVKVAYYVAISHALGAVCRRAVDEPVEPGSSRKVILTGAPVQDIAARSARKRVISGITK